MLSSPPLNNPTQVGAELMATDFGGSTPLHECARKGHLPAAEYLIG